MAKPDTEAPATLASVVDPPPAATRAFVVSGSVGPADELHPAERCALMEGEDCSFLDPDDETLQELARCGIVRYDYPLFLDKVSTPVEFDDAWLELTALTRDEQAAMKLAGHSYRERLGAQGVALAQEAGLDPAWAKRSPFLIVIGMVETELERDEHRASLLSVARERAGEKDPPSDDQLSLSDRTARLLAGAGDAFESEVARHLGEARAHELRTAGDGWPGHRSQLGNRCREPASKGEADAPKRVPSTPSEAKACIANWRDGECRFLSPPEVELQEMARCGIVRFDFPVFLMTREADPAFDPAFADELGLTPAEAATVAEIGEAFRAELYGDVSALALEVGKSREWAEQTPLMGLMMALHEEVDDEADIEKIFERIAKERAGQLEPTPSDSVHERFIRRVTSLGPAFEAALAQALGPRRAGQLRRHADGWPGTRVQTAPRCKP